MTQHSFRFFLMSGNMRPDAWGSCTDESFSLRLKDDCSRLTEVKLEALKRRKISPTHSKDCSSLLYFSGRAVKVQRREVWKPVSHSPARIDSSDSLDPSPSRSYCKVPMLRGIYNSFEISAPHMSGDGTWFLTSGELVPLFSKAPRMEWCSNWALMMKRRYDPQFARERFLEKGISTAKSRKR